MFWNQYPYINLNDLNLDFLLKAIGEMQNEVKNFVTLNAVKYADPIQWDITSQYEKNTIVIDPLTGTAYISVQPVPSGVALNRPEYWTAVFDLSRFITQGNANLTEHVEDPGVIYSTFALSEGDWVIWNGELYKALVNMPIGSAYSVNGNIERVTVEEYIHKIIDDLDTEIQTRIDGDDALNIKIGDLADLATTDKTSVINAINEVYQDATDVDTKVGDLNDLATTDKTSIVNAINEVNTTGGGALAKIGNLDDLTTTDKDSVVDAINEVNASLSNLSDYRIINVLDYGATGDGVTDDTNAVNGAIAALNDASDIRKALYFPSGSYLVGDLTTLSAQCVVFGAGANATRIIPKVGTTRIFEITEHFTEIKNLLFYDSNNTTSLCIYAKLGNGISIHDIKLENIYKFIVAGNTAGTTHDSYYADIYAIYGTLRHEFIRCNGCKSFIDIHDCSFNSEVSYNTSAIVIEPVGDYIDTVKLSNVSIQRYLNAVFMGTSSSYNKLISNIFIDNCIFDGIGGRGVFINVSAGTTANIQSVFIRNTWIAVTGSGYNCITLQNSASGTADLADVVIENCKLIAPTADANSACIKADRVKDLQISGCDMVEYNRAGVEVTYSTKINIVGNEIGYNEFAQNIGSTHRGIIAENNNKLLIASNFLSNNHVEGLASVSNTNYRIAANIGATDSQS